jgi:hypothetical protein
MQELGTGVLDWERDERISDRYGLVKLFDRAGPVKQQIALRRFKEGSHGRLVALVKETRESTHIGDLFHRVFPAKPEVDEQIVLGEGTLFFEDGGVGLVPDDGRKTLWLDMNSLYRAHSQTVTLFFEESPVH